MPEIIVTARHDARDGHAVMLRERINAADFESERFAANLVERLGWAVVDATEAESEETAEPEEQAEPPRRKRRITGRSPEAEQRDQHLEPVGSA
jgi:hypothetical protein